MQKYTAYAFAAGPGEGNGAGVVLTERALPERDMQMIAAEFGFSETAFVQEGKDLWFVRFFTPVCEVPLCGHASIASFAVLYRENRIKNGTYRMQTKERMLSVDVENGFVWIHMGEPFVEREPDAEECAALCRAYGLQPQDLREDCPVRIVNAGIRDIHMIVKDHDTLMRAKQDVPASLAVTGRFGEVGVHMTALAQPGGAVTAYCSNFGPAFGIEEECATGTASAGLSIYLDELGKFPAAEAVFLQGEHMGRPSEIRSRLVRKDGKREVQIGGRVWFPPDGRRQPDPAVRDGAADGHTFPGRADSVR